MMTEQMTQHELGKYIRARIYFIFSCLGLTILIGITVAVSSCASRHLDAVRADGFKDGVRDTRAEAVSAGVGKWVVTNSQGDVEFRWAGGKAKHTSSETNLVSEAGTGHAP